MRYLVFLIKHLLDIPKTVWFNFIVFPLNIAIHLPVLVSYEVKIGKLQRDCICINTTEIRPFMIKFGVEGVDGTSAFRKGYITVENGSKIVFRGKSSFARGVSLRVKGGMAEFGANFYANCNFTLVCLEHVEFGDDCLLGWDVNVRDCDGHEITVNSIQMPSKKKVIIKDHVWIGAYSHILKGVEIEDGSIVAYNSCVLKPFQEKNILIGGYPAKKLKDEVAWKI